MGWVEGSGADEEGVCAECEKSVLSREERVCVGGCCVSEWVGRRREQVVCLSSPGRKSRRGRAQVQGLRARVDLT